MLSDNLVFIVTLGFQTGLPAARSFIVYMLIWITLEEKRTPFTQCMLISRLVRKTGKTLQIFVATTRS